jgi:PAS domain S-box-containing protein
MSILWSPDELRAFVGDGTVVLADRQRQPMPLPAWAAGSVPSLWHVDLAVVYDPDRAHLIRAYKEALREPGVVREVSVRARSGDTWTRWHLRVLNLFDQPHTDGMLYVVDRSETVPAPDPATRDAHHEVPWVRMRCDMGATIIAVEGMVQELYGHTAEEIVGRNALDLAHPDDVSRCLDAGLQVIRNPAVDCTITHRIGRKDGTTGVVHATLKSSDRDDGTWELHHCDAERMLHNELVLALAAEQLIVAYQPLVEVGSGRVTGAEALVRWDHPTRGVIPPLDFIPNTEASGLIVELGGWVLRTACMEAATWPDDLHIAVNLSVRQLADEGIVALVAEALKISGLAPHRLMLEVTESALVDNPEKAIQYLGGLKALGVELALDDFGTGYSSLRYLQRMPVDALKVDRDFVAGLGADGGDTAIVTSVVSLANAFGLRAIAEGVETEEQHQHLALVGCGHAQGFLWGQALPPEQFREVASQSRGDVHR